MPFCFRVLLAELPRYMARYQTSLDRLYQILSVCQQVCTAGWPEERAGLHGKLRSS